MRRGANVMNTVSNPARATGTATAPRGRRPHRVQSNTAPHDPPAGMRRSARMRSGPKGNTGRLESLAVEMPASCTFFQDMRTRNLGEPLPVVSDGAAGIIRAIGIRFPRSGRRRCLAHRMRNLACKVPESRWPESGDMARSARQAPSRAPARNVAGEPAGKSGKSLPGALTVNTTALR